MENEFKFEISYVNESIKCAKNAKAYSAGLNVNITSLTELASKIKIDGLNYGNVNIIKDHFTYIESLDTTVEKMKYEAFNAMISMGTFSDALTLWISEGKITTIEVVDFAKEYMKKLVKNNPDYYKDLKNTTSLQKLLESQGFSLEFINSLNSAFCEELIRNNEMYSREGVVDMAYTFVGMFAMFGYTLDYQRGSSFDRFTQGLYLGTKNDTLGMLDCCNLNDWLLRSVGIDVYEGGAGTQYKYGIDIDSYINGTPENEYQATMKDEYYTNAKPGDIIVNGKHTRMILEKTENGYLMIEEGGGFGQLQIVEYSIEDIKKGYYRVSNLDALYRNTSSTNPGVFLNNIPKTYKEELIEAQEARGTGVFFSPAELSKELNLSSELESKLIEQYNARNEHPEIGVIGSSTQNDEIQNQELEFVIEEET